MSQNWLVEGNPPQNTRLVSEVSRAWCSCGRGELTGEWKVFLQPPSVSCGSCLSTRPLVPWASAKPGHGRLGFLPRSSESSSREALKGRAGRQGINEPGPPTAPLSGSPEGQGPDSASFPSHPRSLLCT